MENFIKSLFEEISITLIGKQLYYNKSLLPQQIGLEIWENFRNKNKSFDVCINFAE